MVYDPDLSQYNYNFYLCNRLQCYKYSVSFTAPVIPPIINKSVPVH